MSFAVLIVGANGSNGRMLRQTLEGYSESPQSERYGLTELPVFDQTKLVNAADIVTAGWDLRDCDLECGLRAGAVTMGLRSANRDTLLGDEHGGRSWTTVFEGAAQIADEIRDFAATAGVSDVVVLNLSSPSRRVEMNRSNVSAKVLLQADSSDVPSAYAYMFGALQAGAHFIDFTPSAVLEAEGLNELAVQFGAQYAGRDGSTGQTYLKLTIAGALATRGIKIENWYSTNILGNRDGQVLEIPGVDVTKMHDKAVGLNSMTALAADSHRIDIRHMPALKDIKEAWDSVIFTDIFGNVGELQVRWKALDTPLAVQSLLDLLRIFVSSLSEHGPGLRKDLGFFFKHPIGSTARTPEFLFSELLTANNKLLLPEMGRYDLNW